MARVLQALFFEKRDRAFLCVACQGSLTVSVMKILQITMNKDIPAYPADSKTEEGV